MSWAEFLSRLLQTSSKVDKAAVFNTKGQPLAASDSLQVTQQDGLALLLCISDPARTVTRITIDNTAFRCFQGNNKALVGTAVNVPERVLVGRLTEDALVVVMGSTSSQGSMLFEVQSNLVERTRRQMAPQAAKGAGEPSQQQTQPSKKLARPPSAVTQEDVLVQLHD